jgi:FAD/FMN-containing dehydrogenase/Fe-S oxidoreductase
LDARKTRLLEDLAGLFRGELLCDPISCAQYACDGSLHQIVPLAVARPLDHDDAATLVAYARDENLPLVPRGAGTTVAGESIGEGIVVDFSRSMNRILGVGEDWVRVEAGAGLDEVNRELRRQGRYFAPDPANYATTTIGGMIGVDAAGSHSIRIGSVRDHVKTLDLILADGSTCTVGSESHQPPGLDRDGDPVPRLLRDLRPLLRRHSGLILEKQPARQLRNRAGYFLRNILQNETVHLQRMLVGSEGTLALWTSAVLATLPLPAHRGILLMVFDTLEGAVEAVCKLSSQQPSACDLLDRRLLNLGREIDNRFSSLIPQNVEAALIVEQTGTSSHQVQTRLEALRLATQGLKERGLVALQSNDAATVDFVWSLPRRVVPLLNRIRGAERPVPLVEDIAVPPEALGDFLAAARRVLHKYDFTATLYSHAAAGQIHLRPFWSIRRAEDRGRLRDFASALYDEVLAVGGTISGEHGLGISRSSFLRRQYGPLYPVFEQIKRIFDPANLFNPGKVLNDDADLIIRHLRPSGDPRVDKGQLQLPWEPLEVLETSSTCNGCGSCRAADPGRMCPVFRVHRGEEASPRAKANTLRLLIQNPESYSELGEESARPLLETCIDCRQCQRECPAEVEIPRLVQEMRAQFVASQGLRREDWYATRIPQWAEQFAGFRKLMNVLGRTRLGRWTLEKMFGLTRERRWPRYASTASYAAVTRGRDAKSPRSGGRTVAFFVDQQARFHDPELLEAACRLLEQQGLDVVIPAGQKPSGYSLFSSGDLEQARRVAEENVSVLAEWARAKCPIVCSEPSAALCLKEDYPLLLPDREDVRIVADWAIDLGDYLRTLCNSGKWRTPFGSLPLKLVYQPPCHLISQGVGLPLVDLLRRVPDLEVDVLEAGCSGMPGIVGWTRRTHELSLSVSQRMRSSVAASSAQFGISECSNCRAQMMHRTGNRAIHPVKVLAAAAGVLTVEDLKPFVSKGEHR